MYQAHAVTQAQDSSCAQRPGPGWGTVPLLFAGSGLGFAAVVALEEAEAEGGGRRRPAGPRRKAA